MLKLTEGLVKSNLFNVKTKFVQTDNLIFRFHYRITVAVLLIGVALVSSREYIGEHISCISNINELKVVINRFCFIMGTFTVIKHHNRSSLNMEVAHPGVGPYVESEGEDIIRHAYYQWVPYVLFFQAICFYFPHLLWREMEKGKLKALADSLREVDMINAINKRKSFESVELQFRDRLYMNRSWTFSLIFCESLNLINLMFQIYITNVFLGYQFLELGPKVYWDPKGDEFNPLDVVFPKVTKCVFRKFGPSGSIQYHDIMCVMALNIVNEKVYAVLWFWYLILFILSVTVLIWRLVSYFLRRSVPFNLKVFKLTALSKIDNLNMTTVIRNLTFGEWMFLSYLASNMSGLLFNELIAKMADSYERGVPFSAPVQDKDYKFEETEDKEEARPWVEM